MTLHRQPQTIYFDESGFTGNNLLVQDQPAFVYAGVAIDSFTAGNVLTEMTRRFHLAGRQLKGKNLTNYRDGQEAISWLLGECKGKACLAVANKKFALAGKFFEYTFEPVLAPQSSLFYSVGFHQFIANFLYIAHEAKYERVQTMLGAFEDLMRTKNLDAIQNMLTPLGQVINYQDPIDLILTFILCHKATIAAEIKHLSFEDNVGKWILELTTTSLFWILSYWSEFFDSMKVFCDKSKPLQGTDRSVFDVMVGRKDRIYMKWGNEPERRLTYNLSEPIVLLDSEEPGITIADIISSAVAFALKSPEDELSKKWLALTQEMCKAPAILPDLKAIDLHRRDPVINSLILSELVKRTIERRSLFTDMEEFILIARKTYQISPPKLTNLS